MKKLRDSVISKLKNVCLYKNDEVEYIALLRWQRYQKPKHFKPSILPKPPVEPYPEGETENETVSPPSSPPSSPTLGRPSLGQSSLGKFSIDKDKGISVDFKKFRDSEKDLTDLLTETLNKYASRGSTWLTHILSGFWEQSIGERMKSAVFAVTNDAVKKYPIDVLALSYVKTVKYGGGKTGSHKYLQKILEEKAGNAAKGDNV